MRLAGIDLNLLVVLDALLTESSVTGAARRWKTPRSLMAAEGSVYRPIFAGGAT